MEVLCGFSSGSFHQPKKDIFIMACAKMTNVRLLWNHKTAKMTMGLQIPLGLPTILHT